MKDRLQSNLAQHPHRPDTAGDTVTLLCTGLPWAPDSDQTRDLDWSPDNGGRGRGPEIRWQDRGLRWPNA